MAEDQEYHRLWLAGGGNPNRQNTPNPQEKKKGKNPANMEEEAYELSDKYKNQGYAIDVKNEKLITLFNTISKAQTEVKEVLGSSEYTKSYKKNFLARKVSFRKKKLAEATETRAQIMELGGRAPPVPALLSQDLSTLTDK